MHVVGINRGAETSTQRAGGPACSQGRSELHLQHLSTRPHGPCVYETDRFRRHQGRGQGSMGTGGHEGRGAGRRHGDRWAPGSWAGGRAAWGQVGTRVVGRAGAFNDT